MEVFKRYFKFNDARVDHLQLFYKIVVHYRNSNIRSIENNNLTLCFIYSNRFPLVKV